ncbi:hypothetical protein SG35_030175 [Thalassomonas actiniarum]|uniref:2TM domain-containing protein n=2 Tax=Thalassomonas actiniarum TaxID=485447 RepID=A0AAF0C4X7_9GAMM|nr:hypothetical protein SG35_030175 [Thalassomonas actiniarum]
MPQKGRQEEKYFFDKPENVRRVIHSLVVICVLLFALDFVLHRHSSHPWEHMPGFYAFYGFIGCVLLVIIAKWMRMFLKRPPDYYLKEKQGDKINTEQTGKAGGKDVAP